MKKLMRLIKSPFKKSAPATPATPSIAAETNLIFHKYEKTFRDLARYDRGERILSN